MPPQEKMEFDIFFDLVPPAFAPPELSANYSVSGFESGVLSMRETSAEFSHPLRRALLGTPETMEALLPAAEMYNFSSWNETGDGGMNVYFTQIVLWPGDNPGSLSCQSVCSCVWRD